MKRTTLLIWLLSLMLLATPVWGQRRGNNQPASLPTDPRELHYPPLHQFKVPQPTRITLANGLVIYLLEDHELPVINLTAYIHTGSRWDPADKVGLADIATTVMRTGGSESKSGDQLDDELDRIAARVECSADNDSGSAGMSVLKDDLDQGLSVLADILINPAFPADKLELAKLQYHDAIARRNDEIDAIVAREFDKLLYGPTSPYARNVEHQTIDNISRADLIAFHQRYYHPNNMIMGVWGDFHSAEMEAKLAHYFGGWPSAKMDLPAVPGVNYQSSGRLFLINKDNVNQSDIAIGHLGGKQSDPDYFSLLVLDRVLSGFSGRFFRNIRSDQGLAYNVEASWNAGFDVPGTFTMTGQTRSENTVKLIKALFAEINKLAQQEVSDAELAGAKESILNSFIFRFDTTSKVIGRMLAYEYYGYPKDFLERYRDSVEQVTKADLLRVAKQYIRPDQFVVLVAGRAADFGTPLSELGLGEATQLDITIPPSGVSAGAAGSTPSANNESLIKGRAILQAAREAIGGSQSLSQIKDITIKTNARLYSVGGFVVVSELTIKYPNQMLNKITLASGITTTQVFNGEVAWVKNSDGTKELAGDNLAEFRNLILRDTISLLTNFEAPGYQAQFLQEATFNDRRVNVVQIQTPFDHDFKVFVDAENSLIIGKSFVSRAGGKATDNEENYSDFRAVAGLQLPFKRLVKRNGQPFAESETSEIQVNQGVTAERFAKP